MDKIIKVQNLNKKYGSFEAVKDISFQVESGSLFAFLGPNGAGKSTTIDILSTLITKNSGTITINNYEIGKDDQNIKKDIGVVFQNSILDDLLSVRENLEIRGSFYGLKGKELKDRINEASNITQCDDFINRRYGKLSGGQKRRADIARALINKPKILFLDEPTTGLDPQTRISVWNTIKDMQKESNMTVFLTTHYMEEAANADYITVINEGTIVAQGTPLQLKQKYTKDILKIYNKDTNIINYLKEHEIKYTIIKDTIQIEITETNTAIKILENLKESIISFEMIHGNMDNVFINIIGKETAGKEK